MSFSHDLSFGIRANLVQFSLQLLQVFLVGSLIGMTRTVLPELASSDFGLSATSFMALATFVVVFGVVKAILNLVAGGLADRWGRRRVLILGWLSALPIPGLILYGPSWEWIILSTVFLGINQGLSWSMALNSKLDLTRPQQRGLVNGFNEFAGYGGVALAGILSALLVDGYGARLGLFLFSTFVVVLALAIALFSVRESRPWALLHLGDDATATEARTLRHLFCHASWQNRSLLALNQAGLVEKFTDAIVWLFFPVYFLAHGVTLVVAGELVAVYGFVWGVGQLIVGPLSDRISRKTLLVAGMWLCGLGVLVVGTSTSMWLWIVALVVIGVGMAMLYPTLGAAVADHADPAQRAGVLGVYRFWRDLGYALGGLGLGVVAQVSGGVTLPFWFVAVSMFLSGLYLMVRLSSPVTARA